MGKSSIPLSPDQRNWSLKARKMKFGKLNDISKVDFGLPEFPESQLFFRENPEAWSPEPLSKGFSLPHLWIGATGWSMKEWLGGVYPKGIRSQDYLIEYGKQFSTIELNTTHYRIPDLETVNRWEEQTPADFRFCPKVLQKISHAKDLGIHGNLIGEFQQSVAVLEDKLGPCFMQLPPYFGPDRLDLFGQFLDRWSEEQRLFIELRHPKWFVQDAPWWDWFAKREVGLVITDVAGRRDVLHMQFTRPELLLRFVGNGMVESDLTRVDEWMKVLKSLMDKGLQEIYFFGHEPDNILAPELAQYAGEAAHARGISCRWPQTGHGHDRGQLSLF